MFSRGLWSMRRAVRALESIGVSLQRQNQLLERLADEFAPIEEIHEQRDLRATTGVDHLDATELALVDEFVARTEREQGYSPTEDEILTHLADERTIDLQTRLKDREREVNELVSQRGRR